MTMNRIIGERSTGKTRQLLQYAYDNNLIVMCARPDRMQQKAIAYGLPGINCIAYTSYLDEIPGPYVIDELEQFMEYCMSTNTAPFVGYTLNIGE